MTSLTRLVVGMLAALVGLCAVEQATAQGYPSKPIRIIVASAPGGLMDVPARLASEYFDRAFGQRVLVENRVGAGGNVGAEAVVKATPDGYTLGLIQLGNVAINPFLFKDMSFDPLNDLLPVVPLVSLPVVMAVGAKVPAANLRELIALARRDPGKLNNGTAGVGTVPHLAGELFSQMAGVKLTHVHYKGAGPALNDLMAGQIQILFAGLGVVRGPAASGAVRLLAVAQHTRLGTAPDIPTADEAGLPGFEVSTWFGIAAPKGTPDSIVAILTREFHAMQDDPAILKRFADGGMESLKESPDQFGVRIRRDYEKFRDIVKAAGLKPE
jgi:tripartite-type tricarboxylate transporter receptor subunit TctC